MERATEPHLIEEAERILRQACTELSLESISIFRKDGTFFYSSDPTIGQPENVERLFQVLNEFAYDFVVGVPITIMVHDSTSCLILKPLYMGEWGEVEGWYLALGSCSEMKCEDLSENLRDQAEQQMKQESSEKLETDDNRTRLRMAFDLPQIVGKELEKNDDTAVTIDGEKGIVVQRYGWSPWGISTKSDRHLPPLLRGLDMLDMLLQTETRGILELDYHQKHKPWSEYTRSKKLLEIILAYNIPMTVIVLLVNPDFFLEFVPFMVALNLFLLLFVVETRSGIPKGEYICSFFPFFVGIMMMVVVFSRMVATSDGLPLFELVLGVYFLLAGILFTVIRWERTGTLSTVKDDGELYTEGNSA